MLGVLPLLPQNVKSARDKGALAEQVKMVAGIRNHLDLLMTG
jgi:hypothetical protein